MQVTKSLDRHRLHYERYNETKKDITHIHNYASSLWVRSCDAISNIGRKVHRLARHTNRIKVNNSAMKGRS